MKIEVERLWPSDDHGVLSWCGGRWDVSDLWDKARDLPVFELPLAHLDLSMMRFDCNDPLDFCRHGRHVIEADLSCPIIMDSKGCILDGRHRICKALILGKETVKAQRFFEYVEPTHPEKS